MRIEVKDVDNKLDFNYGDLLVFQCGKKVLVSKDYDDTDYVGVILEDNIITDCRMSKTGLLDDLRIEHGLNTLVRVIRAENLKLSEV